MASQARQMAADGLGRSLDCSDAQGVSARPPTTPSGTGVNESNSVVWTVVSRPFVSKAVSISLSTFRNTPWVFEWGPGYVAPCLPPPEGASGYHRAA